MKSDIENRFMQMNIKSPNKSLDNLFLLGDIFLAFLSHVENWAITTVSKQEHSYTFITREIKKNFRTYLVQRISSCKLPWHRWH